MANQGSKFKGLEAACHEDPGGREASQCLFFGVVSFLAVGVVALEEDMMGAHPS